MTDKYDRWAEDSPKWLEALTRGLAKAGGDDLLVGYRDIALAFPSRRPHPNSFDFPIIDFEALYAWAKANNWLAATAPEALGPDASPGQPPPVRFRRAVQKGVAAVE
jgi:hypothetical protein